MRLYEYEAKQLLRAEGLPVPTGIVAKSVTDAVAKSKKLQGQFVIKSQVLTGNRMKAGGVVFADTPSDIPDATEELLSRTINGFETDGVLIEETIQFERQIFIGITWDTFARLPVAIVSLQGGVDVEDLGKDSVESVHLSTLNEVQDACFRDLLSSTGFIGDDLGNLVKIFSVLWHLFQKTQANLIEINPLVQTANGRWIILDVHIELDDDALPFVKDYLMDMDIVPLPRPVRQPSLLEIQAAIIDRSDHRGVAGRVVEFNGELGLLIGGGGASLTIFDSIRAHGGKPANYSEIGGNPSVSKVAELTALLLKQPSIKKIAVIMNVVNNTRADLIARGVILGCLQVDRVPSETINVFRVPGSWEDESFQILQHYGIEPSERTVSLDVAAMRAVKGTN